LYWINRNRARTVCNKIEYFTAGSKLLLLSAGLLGGMVSGVTGSGLDIVIFAVLVLVFSLCEKVATPTSIILMACNSAVGFIWTESFGGGVATEAWSYWWVCVPVVVVGAPLGALFIRNRSRYFVAGFLYYAIVAQYICALFVIPQTPDLLLFNTIVVVLATVFFRLLAYYGNLRIGRIKVSSEVAGDVPI
ncbi:MAG TPA: sulfite exporter TauE/SafE family protein, partial [Gammaproteobacteria bacterium]|nr:sulfite exporter TauE/SafE family protein [Gammaproteobacteria bacterium]